MPEKPFYIVKSLIEKLGENCKRIYIKIDSLIFRLFVKVQKNAIICYNIKIKI